jgi:phage/plasmid-like protein (TIGR03299 family)
MDPTGKHIVLGNGLSKDYAVLQNSEAFEVFDKVLLPQGYTYETAGAIKSGKTVWILAKRPENEGMSIVGEEIEDYMLLSTSHDGTRQCRFLPTMIRVVCENTLNMALSAGRNDGFAITHVGDMEKRLRKIVDLVIEANDDFRKAKELFVQMKETQITPFSMREYLLRVYPPAAYDPKKITASEVLEHSKSSTRIEEVIGLYYTGRGNNGRTLYDAYNAVTEYVDHHGRAKDRIAYMGFGDGRNVKTQAFAQARRIVTGEFPLNSTWSEN